MFDKKLKTAINLFIIFNLLFAGFFANGQSIDELEQQIKAKQDLIQELEKKVSALKESIKYQQSTQSTLKKQISNMEAEIQQLTLEIRLTQTKINETGLQIEKLGNSITQLEGDISSHREYLASAIRAFNEYDRETPFEIILKNENFSDFFDQMEYMENLQKNIQEKLIIIKSLKEQTGAEKQKQENFMDSLESLNQDLKGKTLVLNFQKGDKQDLLTATKNQEKIYQAQLKELRKQQEGIQKEIYSLEDKLRIAIDPNSIPAGKKGLLSWPIKNTITQNYGPTSVTGFINNVYNFHNGIDVRASIGAQVKAAYDGVVSGVGNNEKYAYGKWITINHQNGLTTLYGHLSLQKVSVGQKISRGEVIGYSGNTGYSTGPHLHFSVYATNTFKIESRWFGALPIGGSLNPLNYLD
jgi:murein DD-endopeptidase MepM/ murein hydrolase activator NlpD